MNPAIIIAIVVLLGVVGLWVITRPRSKHSQPIDYRAESKVDSADMGRHLRKMMLELSPEKAGQQPSTEFPRIYAVLLDWPLGDQIATVFSSSTGAASLYTTSTFGIIGGEAHETVRNAATRFVRAAERHFDAAIPTTQHPYPTTDRIRFYFLTFDGVRVIDTDLNSIDNDTSPYSDLFNLGQVVITELREVTE